MGAGLVVTACGVALVACFVAWVAVLAGVAAFPSPADERLGDAFCPAAVTAFVPASRLVRGDGLDCRLLRGPRGGGFRGRSLCWRGLPCRCLVLGRLLRWCLLRRCLLRHGRPGCRRLLRPSPPSSGNLLRAFVRVGAVAFFGAGAFFFVEAAFAGAAFLCSGLRRPRWSRLLGYSFRGRSLLLLLRRCRRRWRLLGPSAGSPTPRPSRRPTRSSPPPAAVRGYPVPASGHGRSPFRVHQRVATGATAGGNPKRCRGDRSRSAPLQPRGIAADRDLASLEPHGRLKIHNERPAPRACVIVEGAKPARCRWGRGTPARSHKRPGTVQARGCARGEDHPGAAGGTALRIGAQ